MKKYIGKTFYHYAGHDFTIYSFLFVSIVVTRLNPILYYLQSKGNISFNFHKFGDGGVNCMSGYRCYIIKDFKND